MRGFVSAVVSALLAGVPAVACAQESESPPAAQARPLGKFPTFNKGVASWYGQRFHGRRTASGERFDMDAYTAAHPTLPFGTLVEVRSLLNGQVVHVRINDRGPFHGRRVIDLSRGAAEVIGLGPHQRGTTLVELRLIEPAPEPPPRAL